MNNMSKKNALQKAFDRTELSKITQSGNLINKALDNQINLSGIYTELIFTAGRFVEAYASDLIISIDSMKKNIIKLIQSEEDNAEIYESFGFRESGVDHEAYILNNYKTAAATPNYNMLEHYYRKIYVIKITKEKKEDNSCTIEFALKDITHKITLGDLRLDIIKK